MNKSNSYNLLNALILNLLIVFGLNAQNCVDDYLGVQFDPGPYCTGDVFTAQILWEGDVQTEVEWSADFFENGFTITDGSLSEVMVSPPWGCPGDPWFVWLNVFCEDGIIFDELEVEYYPSILPEITWEDPLTCSFCVDPQCPEFEITMDPPIGFFDGTCFQGDGVESGFYDLTFTVTGFDSNGPCGDLNQSLQYPFQCNDCGDPFIQFDPPIACEGDTVTMSLVSDDPLENVQFLVNNGLVLTGNPVQFEAQGFGCEIFSSITAEFSCGGSTAFIDGGLSILGNPELSVFTDISDCTVCVNSFCSDDFVSWDNGEESGIGSCMFLSEPSGSGTVTFTLGDPGCAIAQQSFDYPCSGCPVVQNNLPESYPVCKDDFIELSIGTFGDPSIEVTWRLDGVQVAQGAFLFFPAPDLSDPCGEFFELSCSVNCSITDIILFEHQLEVGVYELPEVELISNNCAVEIESNCDEHAVFWSAGSESGDGTLFEPESGSGNVSFFVNHLFGATDCIEVVFNVDYDCDAIGIDEKDIFNSLILQDHELLVFTEVSVGQRLRVIGHSMDGKSVHLNEVSENRFTIPNWMNGLVLFECLVSDVGSFSELLFVH